MGRFCFVFAVFTVFGQQAVADGFGWHFNTIANYTRFMEFFRDGKPKAPKPADLDGYYYWYLSDEDRAAQEKHHKSIIDHFLSGALDYGRLSYDETQILDVLVPYFVTQTSSHDALRVEWAIDSIATWCFDDYLDLQKSAVTKLFASGRRLNTNNPVQCTETTGSLEDAVPRLSNSQELSEDQLRQIKEIDERSNGTSQTCYNSYVALSPSEVGLLAEELEPVIAAAEFYEEECPLTGFYEYVRSTHAKEKGIFAWTSD